MKAREEGRLKEQQTYKEKDEDYWNKLREEGN
jgi:hypothetical protein